MRSTHTKRRIDRKSQSTIALTSKRRRPLRETTGNTVPQRRSAKVSIVQKTSLTAQHHASFTTGLGDLPPTCPLETTELWKEVYAGRRLPAAKPLRSHDMPPKGTKRGRVAGSSTRRETSRERLEGDQRALSESAVEEAEEHTTTTSISRRTGPHQARFRISVLEPRGISLHDHKPKAKPPEAHFGIAGSGDGDYYEPELSHVTIWLSMDASYRDRISKHYSFMEKMRLSEDQFATYAKQIFFRCEDWELNLPHDRLWRGERIDTFVNPAEPTEHWLPPPLLLTQQPGGDGYRWDVRPDCAYWLSNRGFNEEYEDAIPGCCFVYRNWISNPYLTVEFKKNDWKPGVAATQLLTAAAIALYNRCELTTQARRAVQEADDLRHYGITFEGPHFVVYVVEPIFADPPPSIPASDNDSREQYVPSQGRLSRTEADDAGVMWRGCEMRRLAQGDCTVPRNVELLSTWVNAIHRWGITTHARKVQMDIKTCLMEEGIDTSALY